MVKHTGNAVGLACSEGMVHAADFWVFGLHAKHDGLRVSNKSPVNSFDDLSRLDIVEEVL